MIEGNPFFAIRDAIGSFHPDLLGMGTHARSGISVAMIGSLAREFLIDAACDVLVARALAIRVAKRDGPRNEGRSGAQARGQRSASRRHCQTKLA